MVLFPPNYKPQNNEPPMANRPIAIVTPEERLERCIQADILAHGSSSFRMKGLGDPLFELVCRRLYSEEIDGIDAPNPGRGIRTTIRVT